MHHSNFEYLRFPLTDYIPILSYDDRMGSKFRKFTQHTITVYFTKGIIYYKVHSYASKDFEAQSDFLKTNINKHNCSKRNNEIVAAFR